MDLCGGTEMTDNEIIKALECLAGGFGILCRDCAFNGKFPCRENAAKSALDLIKRQQDKNDRYEEQCSKCGEKTAKTIINLQDLLAERKAEITELEAEIDKQYEQAKADILGNMSDGGTSCHWCIEQHRAEAIKEFAERLKEAARTEYDSDGWVIGSCVDVRDIDAILKQNTEGKQDAVQDTATGAE
jgi:hypothetical protein